MVSGRLYLPPLHRVPPQLAILHGGASVWRALSCPVTLD